MRSRTISILLLSLAAILVAIAPSAHAGWVLTQADGMEVLISNGMMKGTFPNGSMLFDANKNIFYFIDDQRKVIASGTVDDFCEGMTQTIDSMLENVPPEQREMVKQMMKNQAGDIELVDKGPGEKILGFSTTRYEARDNGTLRAEVWVTQDESLVKELQVGVQALVKLTSCMQEIGFGGSVSYQGAPAYQAIFETAVPLKTIEYDEKGNEVGATILSKRDIPAETFALPAGYNKEPLSAIFRGGQ